jgi:signal transduction histidine kinase
MSDRLSIMILEDEEAHAEAIRRAFQMAKIEADMCVTGTLLEYRAAVDAKPPDIALLDLNLPDGRALEVLTSPSESAPFPVLIMTSHGDEHAAVEAMKAGALDYIVKSSEAFLEIPHTVSRALREWSLLLERRRTEEHLRAAQRMEAIGRLAGGVAHDFNNLLSVILNYAQFALDEVKEGDPLYKDLCAIRKAGERAAGLTRQLLAFSRKQMLMPQILNLNKVINGMTEMLRRLLGEDIELTTNLSPGLGSVTADPGQIEQVIMNLAVNARDAMPKGGKLLIETSDAELDEMYSNRHMAVIPGPYVMLSVTDDGCGMDATTKARLFEPFFTTKEVGKGTGLGLATIYGIVKQSDGNIWVYSEPGRGTTFKVYLPRQSDSAGASMAPSRVITHAQNYETVLLVEDEEDVRKIAERILRNAGYTVLTAANGADALLVYEKVGAVIDLLLTDVVMPIMSGRELSDRLTKLCPGLRVLYMSGYTDDAIFHHDVLKPGTHFISKPFNAPDLTEKVRIVLDDDRIEN